MSEKGNDVGDNYLREVAENEADKNPPAPEVEQQAEQQPPQADPNAVEFDLSVEEFAELCVVGLDIAVCRYAGDDMALTEREQQRLMKPTLKLLQKYELAIKLSPEYAFAFTAALIYLPKLSAAGALPNFGFAKRKNAAAAPASSAPATSTQSTTTTTAEVDGKPVPAEVVAFPKKANQ